MLLSPTVLDLFPERLVHTGSANKRNVYTRQSTTALLVADTLKLCMLAG